MVLWVASVPMSERVQVGSASGCVERIALEGDEVVRGSLDVRLHYHLQQGFKGAIQSLVGLN